VSPSTSSAACTRLQCLWRYFSSLRCLWRYFTSLRPCGLQEASPHSMSIPTASFRTLALSPSWVMTSSFAFDTLGCGSFIPLHSAFLVSFRSASFHRIALQLRSLSFGFRCCTYLRLPTAFLPSLRCVCLRHLQHRCLSWHSRFHLLRTPFRFRFPARRCVWPSLSFLRIRVLRDHFVSFSTFSTSGFVSYRFALHVFGFTQLVPSFIYLVAQCCDLEEGE
jgi:hypothetical protein